MRVLYVCLIFASIVSVAYALPPRYSRYTVEDSLDDDEEASVEDEATYDDDNDMYTFPTGGPRGPPANKYMQHMPPGGVGRGRADEMDEEGVYYLEVDPEYLYGYGDQLSKSTLNPGLSRQLVRKEQRPEVEQEEEDEAEQEDEEEQDEEDEDAADQDDDSNSDDEFGIPDYNVLFPNPEGRPRGPNDYQAYVKHLPQNQRQQPQQQQQQRSQYERRNPPAPPRRYRTENALTTYIDDPDVNYIYDDAVIVDGFPVDRSRILEDQQEFDEDNEAEDDNEDVDDDGDADDDVDFSVPSYDTLFPVPPGKQVGNAELYSGLRNSWNNPPMPSDNRRQHGYGRLVRLLQSPMHPDYYNPEYVIDPTIAINRRNERLRSRYRNPQWRMRNILTPYNYKPILYQQGHWGDPREHDVNPYSGDHYLGGIYNGKNYY